ncbi:MULTISPECIES: hypothetical protein [Calothrix]|nr:MULTISPECIES: hypothetical protein [Calothrix]
MTFDSWHWCFTGRAIAPATPPIERAIAALAIPPPAAPNPVAIG